MWEPGIAQADFGEADVVVQGVRTRVHVLVVTFPYSNARYAAALPGETSECVCEGLRHIFKHVGLAPLTPSCLITQPGWVSVTGRGG